MERRLRTSEGWLATPLGSIGDGIIACDNSGEIALMNRATGVVQASHGRKIIASVAPNPSHLEATVAQQLSGWESAAAKGKQLMGVLGLYEESSAQPAKNPVYDFSDEHRVYSLV